MYSPLDSPLYSPFDSPSNSPLDSLFAVPYTVPHTVPWTVSWTFPWTIPWTVSWTVPCTVKDSSIRLQYLRHISTATFMSTKMKRQKKVQFVMYLFIEDLLFYSLYRSEEPLLNLCVQLVIDMIYNHGFDLKLIHFQFSQIWIHDMDIFHFHCNVCVL